MRPFGSVGICSCADSRNGFIFIHVSANVIDERKVPFASWLRIFGSFRSDIHRISRSDLSRSPIDVVSHIPVCLPLLVANCCGEIASHTWREHIAYATTSKNDEIEDAILSTLIFQCHLHFVWLHSLEFGFKFN